MSESLFELSEHLGQVCLATSKKVTVAESCTAGGISAAITDVAGSSAWFEAGFVVYSNEMKQKLLGVEGKTLFAQGAVSEEVVEQMLYGALKAAVADAGVSVSGIAGPGGGSEQKPVGQVCFAVGSMTSMSTYTFRFDGDRAEVRASAVEKAMSLLITYLEGESS